MNLIIHRGTQEIGGTCVELSTQNSRILIDFGMPLVTSQKERFDSRILLGKSIEELKKSKILPDLKGLYSNEEKEISAILISHSHPDHYGLLNYVHKDIPIYMSQGAEDLIAISSTFTPIKVVNFNSKIIRNKKTFSVGDMRITPYLVDHSAFDALAFLIEAGGRRLFYSGDFRGHGRKSILFKQIIKNPPKDIDCLLMEGTALGSKERAYSDELSVQKRIEEILKEASNITFLFVSSQNIDRIVSAYKACRKTDSIFVIDVYTAYILEQLKKSSVKIPQFDWRDMRVKFYANQYEILKKRDLMSTIYRYQKRKIDFDEINNSNQKILMIARDNSIFPKIIKKLKSTQGAKIIYSMWEGYLSEPFKDFCKKNGLIIEKVHASGHATVEDLRAFASALKPKALIPIHTFSAARYEKLFENVKILKDGEVFNSCNYKKLCL